MKRLERAGDRSMSPGPLKSFAAASELERQSRIAQTEALRREGHSDLARWRSAASHDEVWQPRGKMLAGYVHPGERVFEFGAGNSIIPALLPPGCTYVGSDAAPLKEETLVLDLNARTLPPLAGYDVAMLCGVLEYVHDLTRLVAFLSRYFRSVVCCYFPRLTSGSDEIAKRRYSGWFNDFTMEEFSAIFMSAGFVLSRQGDWTGQALFRWDKMQVGIVDSRSRNMAILKNHIEHKIHESTLEMSPFPHLIIEDFFPEETWRNILLYNPFKHNKGEEWLAAAMSANVSARTPYYARKQINFHANAKFEASPDSVAFWDEFKTCFLSTRWFEHLVLEKYPAYFQLRFGDLSEDPNFLSYFRKELFLQRHDKGYCIGPHTDIPTRVFTCIFSFAANAGFEEFGTQMLAPKDPLVRCWGNDHYAPDEFTVKKVAPYKPNNFLLFFKTRHSFHSVKGITDDVPNQRYGMQFQFYEPREGLFKDLSVPDLMVTKHKTARDRSRSGRISRALFRWNKRDPDMMVDLR